MTRFLLRATLLVALLFLPWLTLTADAQPSAGNRVCTFQSTATAAGNGTACEVLGYTLLSVQVSGTMTGGLLIPEGTIDGTNYQPLICLGVPSLNMLTNFIANGNYWCTIKGYRLVRVRVANVGASTSASVSGHATVGTWATNFP